MRKTLRETLVNHFLTKYPQLRDRADFRRHWMRLHYGTCRDKEGLLRAGQMDIEKDMGMTHEQVKAAGTCAGRFLLDFARTMRFGDDRYRVLDHVPGELCRRINFKPDAEDLLMILREFRGDFDGDKRIYFDSLKPYDYSRHRKALKTEREAAVMTVHLVKCEGSRRVIEYFMGIPTTGLTALIRENLAAAREEAMKLDGPAREQALRRLAALEEGVNITYEESPEGRTSRVFGGGGLQGMKGAVRRVLLRGTWNCDVTNSQLALAATFWHIEEVHDYLSEGRKIWDDLIPWMDPTAKKGSARWADIKEVVKDYVYALVFGMSKTRIKRELTEELAALGIEQGGERYLSHWMVEQVLVARERVATEIELRGYGEDAFGKQIPFERYGPNESNAPSIMAEIAQSWELRFMLPLFDWLEEHKDEALAVVYSFDGLTISIRHANKAEQIKAKLSAIFAATVAPWNVPTRLEWELNGGAPAVPAPAPTVGIPATLPAVAPPPPPKAPAIPPQIAANQQRARAAAEKLEAQIQAREAAECAARAAARPAAPKRRAQPAVDPAYRWGVWEESQEQAA